MKIGTSQSEISQPSAQSPTTTTKDNAEIFNSISQAGYSLRSEAGFADSFPSFAIDVGSASSIGLRKEMEDFHRCEVDLNFSSGKGAGAKTRLPQTYSPDAFAYLAAFDGHAGRRAAEYAERRLYEEVLSKIDEAKTLEDTLREAFATVEQNFLELARAQEWMDGTTAAVAILTREASTGAPQLTIGNVGDTEILLGDCFGGHEVLSVKHTLINKDELERIRRLGGRDYKRRLGHPKYNPQVISLAVSRAIGDLFFKDDQFTDGHPSGLVAEPHISSRVLCGARNWFLVLGCDGLWDVCDYSQVHDFVRKTLKSNTPQEVSQQLIEMAQQKGSPDNITVLVVYIQNVSDAD